MDIPQLFSACFDPWQPASGNTLKQPLTGTITMEHGPVEKHTCPDACLHNQVGQKGWGSMNLQPFEKMACKNKHKQRLHDHAQANPAGFWGAPKIKACPFAVKRHQAPL